jgi:hypothetical protein
MDWQSVTCYRITVDYCMVIPAGAYSSVLRNLMGWLFERQGGSLDVIGCSPRGQGNFGVPHVASPFQPRALLDDYNL